MKLGDALVKAIEDRDMRTIGQIAEHLSFGPRVQRNYRETYEYVCRLCQKRGVEPPDLPEWDELLRESEGG
jgi:hypothetical protein